MFTGLIKEVGSIKSITQNAEGKEIIIHAPKLISEIQIDDSVATNGVCLTATEIKGENFKVQAVHMTLEKTNIGQLRPGSKVNLELALRPMDRLGGHIVQGHVGGIGSLKKVVKRGKNYELTISFPKGLRKYFIEEGSIAIDGISLTIARLSQQELTVSIIPHTWENTTLSQKNIGESINLEVDMMAKYLENFINYGHGQKTDINKLLES